MADKYIQSLMGDNEKMLLVTRQHWFVVFRTIVAEIMIILILIAISIVVSVAYPPAALLAPIVGLLLVIIPAIGMLRDLLIWYNRQYIVTNRRVIQISGVFNKNVVDSSLEKVNDVKMSQSFFGRLFDYGNVEILTASELGINQFHRIGDPVHFKTAMLNAKEKLGFEEDARFAKPADDIPTLIAKLDELRKQGIVSEDEFQTKKVELLAKI
jgi:uncharacterized membrane protein YdbT with pleckstrin-like domain